MIGRQSKSGDSLFTVITFPLKMFLRIFCFSVLIYDTVLVTCTAVYSIIRTLYRLAVPPPLKSLQNEVALVVGAGKGIGRAIALELSDLGATVLCVDINKVNNESVVQAIKKKGRLAVSYLYDMSKEKNVKDFAAHVRRDVSGISMLFYCCGLPIPKLNTPQKNIQVAINDTVMGFYWLIEEFLNDMTITNHGHIVALTSKAGPDNMPSNVAQFAVQGLVESVMEKLRSEQTDSVFVTLIHIYPFIVADCSDTRSRSESFRTITPEAAAASILDSVRRNYVEASVPKHFIFIEYLIRILPREATFYMLYFLNR